MCTQISWNGKLIETCGQLWDAIGRDNVSYRGWPSMSFEPQDCLCHIDIEATAAKAGLTSRSGWDDAGVDFIWEARAPLLGRIGT